MKVNRNKGVKFGNRNGRATIGGDSRRQLRQGRVY